MRNETKSQQRNFLPCARDGAPLSQTHVTNSAFRTIDLQLMVTSNFPMDTPVKLSTSNFRIRNF